MTDEKSPVKSLPYIRKKLIDHGHPEWIIQTEYIADIFSDMMGVIGKRGSIFQPGCGCGYVLDALWEVGYRNLTGLDRNNIEKTIWNPRVKFIHSTVGTLVDCDNNDNPKNVLDALSQFDVVLCHRFLHVFPDGNDWLFEKIAKLAGKFLIILEGEEETKTPFWHHIKRNYKKVFERYGLHQIFEEVNMFPLQNFEITTVTLRVFTNRNV